MKFLILLAFLLPLPSFAYNFEMAEYIANRAKDAGLNPAIMVSVAICESGKSLNDKAVGDNGNARGVWQFWKKTFNWMSQSASTTPLNYLDFEHQTEVAIWAFKNGFSNHWTCARQFKHLSLSIDTVSI